MFMEAIPDGYDKATDGIVRSLRIELAGTMNAQCTSFVPISAADGIAYPMIMVLLIGCVLFARKSLRGQPKLQQRLVKLAVYTALGSDVSPFLPFVESADA
jgi:hypothetical protein